LFKDYVNNQATKIKVATFSIRHQNYFIMSLRDIYSNV